MQINNREYQSVNNISAELTLDKDKNYLFSLNYLSAISAIGDNPEKYLQGQLTCDVTKITYSNMQPGALCNIQGRIISLLNVILWNNTYYLILPKDLQEKVQKILHKTAMFSKIKITPENNFEIFGFYLQNPKDIVPASLPKAKYEFISNETFCSYSISENLYIIITKSSNSLELLNKFPTQQLRKDLAWHTLLLKSSIYEIYPNSTAIFLPHRLNLQNTSYLSFTKGCFIGQEIIARTQYLAKLKHSMHLYIIKTEEKLHSGQKIYDTGNLQEVGEIIDYSILADNQYIIACSMIFEHPKTVKFAGHENITVLRDYTYSETS